MISLRTLPLALAIVVASGLATFAWSAEARAQSAGESQTRDAVNGGNGIGPGAANTREEATPAELREVGVDEKLDAQVPTDAMFKDENDQPVRLGDLFDGKRPTLLTFAYYSCPTLCSLILSSVAEALKPQTWTIGKEFDVVTISIDPKETLAKTKDKQAAILAQYGHASDPAAAAKVKAGWHFLRADDATIKRIAATVGYRYKYDEETQQYGHPAALVLLKPNGRVSRYLYGLEFPPADVKLGLLEASEGKSISAVEQVILFCYRYDKSEGKYVLIANRVMRIGGGFCALCLIGFLSLMWRRERRHAAAIRATENAAENATENATEASARAGADGHAEPTSFSHAPGGDMPIVPMENHT